MAEYSDAAKEAARVLRVRARQNLEASKVRPVWRHASEEDLQDAAGQVWGAEEYQGTGAQTLKGVLERLGYQLPEPVDEQAENVVHFAPWGSQKASCGVAVPLGRQRVNFTDRRVQTTCVACRSTFAPTGGSLITRSS